MSSGSHFKPQMSQSWKRWCGKPQLETKLENLRKIRARTKPHLSFPRHPFHTAEYCFKLFKFRRFFIKDRSDYSLHLFVLFCKSKSVFAHWYYCLWQYLPNLQRPQNLQRLQYQQYLQKVKRCWLTLNFGGELATALSRIWSWSPVGQQNKNQYQQSEHWQYQYNWQKNKSQSTHHWQQQYNWQQNKNQYAHHWQQHIYGNKTKTNINNLEIDLDHFKGLETNTANTLQRNKKRLLNDTQIAKFSQLI